MGIQDGKDETENCSLLYYPHKIFKGKDVIAGYVLYKHYK